ncbi:MAG: C25 family cysteine peptidase [bacterium]
MRFRFLLTISLIPFMLTAAIVNPQSEPQDTISVGKSQKTDTKMIFDYCKYFLLCNPAGFNTEELKYYSFASGFDIVETAHYSQDSIAAKVSALHSSRGRPAAIILVGDEIILKPHCELVNPYSGNHFSTDDYFAIDGDSVNPVCPVFRLPVKTQSQLDNLLSRTVRFMQNASLSDISLMTPFEDINSDSIEDYHYCMTNERIRLSLAGDLSCSYSYGSDCPYPKYLYDGALLPDELLKPHYDWDISHDDFNECFENPALVSYWGHGNELATVMPHLSTAYMTYYNMNTGGLLFLFSCLTGNFSNDLNQHNTCLAESLLLYDQGASFVLASSTETFLQYNRNMLLMLYDCLDNSLFPVGSDESDLHLYRIVHSLKAHTLSFAGLNRYSYAQARSYHAFGLPFLIMMKTGSPHLFDTPDTLYTSNPRLDIHAYAGDTLFIFSDSVFYDTFAVSSGLNSKLITNTPEGLLYISSYKNGYLHIDSVSIIASPFHISGFDINDITGDNDNTAECSESLFVSFDCFADTCRRVRVISGETHVIDSVLDICAGTMRDSVAVIMKDSVTRCRMYFVSGSDSFVYDMPVERRAVQLDSVIMLDDYPLAENEYVNFKFHFSFGGHDYDSLLIDFISDSADFIYETVSVNNCSDPAVVFNTIRFTGRYCPVTIRCSSRFLKNEFSMEFSVPLSNELFVYDPAGMLRGSSFLNFLRDSLGLSPVTGSALNDSVIYPAYIFSMGNYPDNNEMDIYEADFIRELFCRNIPLYLEGGDCLGYDSEGRDLQDLFNIDNAYDGSDISSGTRIYFTPLDDSLTVREQAGCIDYYNTDNCMHTASGRSYSSLSLTGLAQSISVSNLHYPDSNKMYYLYYLFLMRPSANLLFPGSITMKHTQTLNIFNGGSTVMMEMLHTPSFLRSVQYSKRIIPSDTSISIKLIPDRQFKGLLTDSIVFTVFSDTFSIEVNYLSPHSYALDREERGVDPAEHPLDKAGDIKSPVSSHKPLLYDKAGRIVRQPVGGVYFSKSQGKFVFIR